MVARKKPLIVEGDLRLLSLYDGLAGYGRGGVAVSPDGRWALVASDKDARLVPLEGGAPRSSPEGLGGRPFRVSFAPDGLACLELELPSVRQAGQRFLTPRRGMVFWDPETDAWVHRHETSGVLRHDPGSFVAAPRGARTVARWSRGAAAPQHEVIMRAGSELQVDPDDGDQKIFVVPRPELPLLVTEAGTLLTFKGEATDGKQSSAFFEWDLEARQARTVGAFSEHFNFEDALHAVPGGRRVLAYSYTWKWLAMWDLAAETELWRTDTVDRMLLPSQWQVRNPDLAVDPSGRRCVLRGRENSLQIRDLDDGGFCIGSARLESSDCHVGSFAFIPEGRLVVSLGDSLACFELTGGAHPGWRGRAPGLSTERGGELDVGSVVDGTLEIRSLLGEGGMGKVHRAYHRGWGIALAVKSPRQEAIAARGGYDAFVREAETWVGLDPHPNVVSCFYVRTISGLPRIVAELVDGGSLHDWVLSGRLYLGGSEAALARVLDVAIQSARGLDHAHQSGLIHQDVKPRNVLLTREGLAKVTDFGLARGTGTAGSGGAKADVTVGGMTVAYCSPEQAAGARVTRATDVWSWAVSVMELFAKGCTWATGVAAPLVLHSLDDGHWPSLPPAVRRLLARCFERAPEARPGDLGALATELVAVYGEVIGRPYPRPAPASVDLLADGLNNRGLSMLDLGRDGDALAAFDEALRRDPSHVDAFYNRALLRLRTSQALPEELEEPWRQLFAERPADASARIAAAWCAIEIGDGKQAKSLLDEAARLTGSDDAKEIERVRSEIREGTHRRAEIRCPVTSDEGRAERLHGRTSLSADGTTLLLGGEDGSVSVVNLRGTGSPSKLGDHDVLSAVALAPDGQRAAVLDRKGLHRYDRAPDGSFRAHPPLLLRFEGHFVDTGVHLVIDSDGRRAFASGVHAATVVDLVTGESFTWDHPEPRMANVPTRIAAGGGLLATTSYDGHEHAGTLRLYSASERKLVANALVGLVGLLQVSADGSRVRALDSDGRFTEHDAIGRRTMARSLHRRLGTRGRLREDGTAMWIAGERYLRFVEVPSGRCLRSLTLRDEAISLDATPDGSLVAIAVRGGTVEVHALEQVTPAPARFSRPRGGASAAADEDRLERLKADARRALDGGDLASARTAIREARALPGRDRDEELLGLWGELGHRTARGALSAAWIHGSRAIADEIDVTWPPSTPPRPSHRRVFFDVDKLPDPVFGRPDLGPRPRVVTDGDVRGIAVAPDGRGAVVAYRRTEAWKVGPGEEDRARRHAAAAAELEKVKAAADHARLVRCDLSDRTVALSILTEAEGSIEALAASEDGLVAFVSGAAGLRFIDARTGTVLAAAAGGRAAGPVALTADGRHACVRTTDGAIAIYAADPVRRFDVRRKAPVPRGLAISADASRITLALADVPPEVWAAADGTMLGRIGTQPASAVALTRDGERVLVGGPDGIVALHRAAGGERLAEMAGHQGPVVALLVAADDRWAVSAADDGIRLWSLDRRSLEHHVPGLRAIDNGLAWTPDGRWLVVATPEHHVTVVHFDWDREIRETVEWDDAVRPHLVSFLLAHTPVAGGTRRLVRAGRASFDATAVEGLHRTLRSVGLGWVDRAGVDAELARMAAGWDVRAPRPWWKPW